MATVPVGALSTPLLVYLPNHYAGLLGISLVAVGSIFALIKVLDIAFDPTVGLLMDRTRTRIGRYRAWLIAGAPLLMAGVWMLFLAEKGVGEAYLAFWLVVLYLGFSIVVLSQAAWGAVLATSYHERSRLFAWGHVVSVLGAIAVLLLPSLVDPSEVAIVPMMGWLIIASIPVTTLIVALGVPEPIPPRRDDVDRLRLRDFPTLIMRPTMKRLLAADLLFTLGPAITSPLYLFFFRQARGYTATEANLMLLVFIVGSMFGAPLWAAAARRFGKHRTLMTAAALYAVAQGVIVLLPARSIELMGPGMFIAGAILGALSFLIRAMVADVGDEVRLETGQDRIGLLYALVTSTAKVGTAAAVFVTFLILDRVGFNAAPDVVNTSEAMRGLVLTYGVAPVILVMLGAVVMTGYKLDARRHDEIRAALEARDAALVAATG